MKNTVTKTFRKSMNCKTEVNRTREFTIFICGECNKEVTINSSNYNEYKPCVTCLKRQRGKENFIRKAIAKFGNAFDISKAILEYNGPVSPVTIRCIKHDYEYSITPTRFTAKAYKNQPAKGGCPKCAYEVQLHKNNKSIDHYLGLLKSKFPSIAVVAHGSAVTNLERIELNCPIHGNFVKTLAAIVKTSPSTSNLCPHCSREKLSWHTRQARTDIPGIVYFVYFKSIDKFKLGVTYKTVKERLRGYLNDIEIVWTYELPELADAYHIECTLFRKFKEFKTTHPDKHFGGYTEFVNSYIPKPSKRFIEETLCRKKPKQGNSL